MYFEHHLPTSGLRKHRGRLLRGSPLCTILLVVVLFAACGGAPAKSGTGAKSGGVVTVLNGSAQLFTDNFNPWLYTHNTGTQGLIYETMFHWNRLDGKITQMLATNQVFTDNNTGITITARQGVKWSDGQPFSADDIFFTLNMSKTFHSIDATGLGQEMKSITEPDANTVHITLVKPSSTVLWDLQGMFIVPKHIWQNVKQNPEKELNKNPIGTGPFVVKSFAPEKVVYGRNPNYWQPGKPSVDAIQFPAYVGNDASSLALTQGIADWSGLFIPDIEHTYVARDPQHNHYWFSPANTVMLYLNLTKWPFNQLPVRQAISAAVDRDQLVKTAEQGYDPVASPTGVLPQQQKDWLDPQYNNLKFGGPDPKKASSILESAGFKKGGDGIYVGSNGQRLSFDLSAINGWTDFILAIQIMSTNLKAAGIEAKVNVIQGSTFQDYLSRGKFDAAIYNQGGGPTPFWYYQAALDSSLSAAVGDLTVNNTDQVRWNDPQTQQFLQQYKLNIDPAVEKQALYGLEKIMVDKLPLIPLFYGTEGYEYNTKRFTGWPDAQHPYAEPAPWETGPDMESVALNLRPV